MGSARTSPASRRESAARRAMSTHAVPTRRPCGIPVRRGELWRVQILWSFSVPSLSVKHAAGDGSVAVAAPVAQEGPVAADILQLMQVNFAKQNFFLVVRSFGEHAAEGVAEKRPSPEFEPFTWHRIAADVTSLEANTIHHADVNSVRNRMRPLDGSPGIELRLAKFSLLRWVPSDGRRVKQNARSLQRREEIGRASC